jgi:putative heme-binding domain-containing protein
VCLAAVAAAALAQNKNDDDADKKARREAKRAKQTAVVTAKPPKVRAPGANPFGIKAKAGFKVEPLYTVPADAQGSWVNLTLDDKGRFIAADQYGGLYRFPAPPLGKQLEAKDVEPVPAEIRAVNGMVWAFGALYCSVNDYENKMQGGLYRVSDSDGDDKLDKVELLRGMEGRNDHGMHAVLLAPDGQSLFYVCGNSTKLTEVHRWRVPPLVGEDHLLPRMPDGRGFMRDVLGPGGIIYQVSPDGKQFDVYTSGYRNIFDAAFNRDGELFTYDADMEYDLNTSWYRPTRICHATSGSEWGWRNGTGKWPVFYEDTVPPVVNIGPGSPTGVAFGYGAKFPPKYQNAMFICDWSRGRIHAVHMTAEGSTYTGTSEEIVSGTPLAATDLMVNPADGAMYFTTGGRKVQSSLYRLTYVGNESTDPAPKTPSSHVSDRTARRKLEAFHGVKDPQAVTAAWPYLSSDDRFLRTAARVAIEHQPPAEWQDRVFAEGDALAKLEGLLALTRATGICPQHRKPDSPPVDKAMQSRILDALLGFDYRQLTDTQKFTLLRTLEICMNRFGMPETATVDRLVAQLDPVFPTASFEQNWLLCETLSYLQSPQLAAKGVKLLAEAPTQEEQIEYARSLRMLKAGWTTATRTAYFEWLLLAQGTYRGGASYAKTIEIMRTDAEATLTDDERKALAPVLARKPERKTILEELGKILADRQQVKDYKLDDLVPLVQSGMKGRNFETGRKMFAATGCFACHRFANEGGMTGPDITMARGRYSPKDLIDQIINPSKEINEQFAQSVVTTDDGRVIIGSVVNVGNGGNVRINTNPLDPSQGESVHESSIESVELSKQSPMPTGLLNRLNQDEILDLMAYILSAGDRKNAMFAQ